MKVILSLTKIKHPSRMLAPCFSDVKVDVEPSRNLHQVTYRQTDMRVDGNFLQGELLFPV